VGPAPVSGATLGVLLGEKLLYPLREEKGLARLRDIECSARRGFRDGRIVVDVLEDPAASGALGGAGRWRSHRS
jgi:hypothetical protein